MPDKTPETIQLAYQLMEVAEANAHLADALDSLRKASQGYLALLSDPDTETFDPEAPPVFEHVSAVVSAGVIAQQTLRAWTEILLTRLNA